MVISQQNVDPTTLPNKPTIVVGISPHTLRSMDLQLGGNILVREVKMCLLANTLVGNMLFVDVEDRS